jgi:hypothetical protein
MVYFLIDLARREGKQQEEVGDRKRKVYSSNFNYQYE